MQAKSGPLLESLPMSGVVNAYAGDEQMPASAAEKKAVLHVRHAAVPGRVRLHLPALKRQPRLAMHLQSHLGMQMGIRGVQASAVTGSLLLEFEPSMRTLADIGKLVGEVLALPLASPAAPERTPERTTRELYRWAAAASVPEVVKKLQVALAEGLSAEEARRRMLASGSRLLEGESRRTTGEILREQLRSVPSMILSAAVALSFCTARWVDGVVIGSVMLINGVIGYLTERYADNAIEALRQLGYPQAHVVRGGERHTIPAAQLAPGDLIRLRAGDLVPADARLVKGTLLLDEAMITGESEPVLKHTDPTAPPRYIYQFQNVIFQGTAVVDGRAHAVVLATGQDTELGQINALVRTALPNRTRLQDEMDRLGKTLGAGGLTICALLSGGRLLRRQPTVQTIQNGISLAVSSVPEGLPTVAVTALAKGMQRMLRQQVIIRKLPAVEALGSVTVLCVDKTGTLTLNQMSVEQYWWEGRRFQHHLHATPGAGYFTLDGHSVSADAHPAFAAMLRAGILCNEAKLHKDAAEGLHVSGSATEGALLLAAAQAGYQYKEVRKTYPLATFRRRGERQPWMASVNTHPDGDLLVSVKGAPNAVLALCTCRMDAQGYPVPLTEADRACYRTENERMADAGLRVLAFAQGQRPELAPDAAVDGLTWLGMVGLHDPVRPGVAEAIQRCREAGVRVVVLTGDQHGTALAVARHLGLASDDAAVINAPDLAQRSPAEIARMVGQASVFARVSPEDKLRIVQSLQAAGEVVVMTGDGINDGPALKAADIGVAMGDQSSDVAKELADVVLTQNDFAALVAAVEQGRTIYANIQRAVRYLMVANASEMLLSAATLALGLPYPLRPVQILWLNLISDVFPALALVVEPPDRQVMRQPPRSPDTPLLNRAEWRHLGIDAAAIMGAMLTTYLWALRRYGAGPRASAITFTTATMSEALYVLACRGHGRKWHRGDMQQQAVVWGGIGATVGLHLAINHWGPLRRLLQGSPLGLLDYAVVTAAALAPTLLALARKGAAAHNVPAYGQSLTMMAQRALPAPVVGVGGRGPT
jgi:Ca2+-transporting ATPase